MRKTIRGSILGTKLDLDECLQFAGDGKVKVHHSVERLEDINDIFDRMREQQDRRPGGDEDLETKAKPLGQRREAAVARKSLASGLVSSVPQVAILSNGGYSVMITDAGAGYGTWRNLDVSRWREDATRDCWGRFCYVRDLDGNKQWSVGSQPLRHPGGTTYEHTFSRDKAEFHCVAEDIEIRWSVCVAPGVDAEVRSLTVSNIGRGTRRPRVYQLFGSLPEPPASRPGPSCIREALHRNGIR